MEKTVIHFTPTLRARRARMLNDGLPGLLLLLTGLDGITSPGGEHYEIGWLNILVGGALIAVTVFEWRKNASVPETLINKMDLFAGVVLFVEGLNRYKPWKGFQPSYGYFFIGVLVAVKGLVHSKLPVVRRMVLDGEGVAARTSPVRKLSLRWTDISSIAIGDSAIEFQLREGRIRRLGLRRIENRAEVAAALTDAAGRNGIQVRAGAPAVKDLPLKG
jgi:hypothetical protein